MRVTSSKYFKKRSSKPFRYALSSSVGATRPQIRLYLLVTIFLIGILIGFLWASWHFSMNNFTNFYKNDLEQFTRSPSPVQRLSFPTEMLKTYLNEYETNIDGWFSREILYAIWILTQYQYDHLNIVGGIGEIGVHHGKLTCFLYLMRRYREQTIFAVDVFDNQKLNKDGSGRGQESIFLNSIRKYADIHRHELTLYSGSSLNLNPDYTLDKKEIKWWKKYVVGQRGLQFVSIDGGHTTLLTYSDMCVISNSVINGAVIAVDDITHSGWLGVRDGASRFFAETSKLMTDLELETTLAKDVTYHSYELSQMIINATMLSPEQQAKSSCSRLVPFLQYYNKLFLTTPDFYPYYIDLLGTPEVFANSGQTNKKFLEYNSLRLTFGNVPIWTDNHDLTTAEKGEIFAQIIEPIWQKEMFGTTHS